MLNTSMPKPKFKQIETILWRVLILNLLVAVMKIGVGLLSGALSMVADGFHSTMDGASNVVGLVAMRVAKAPPDSNHPYGHRKAETLASLFIGILLIFTAYEILSSAVQRLFEGDTPQISGLSFGVMIVTIVINLLTSIYERRRGRALKSEILLADAVHTRSDIGVSLTVLAGLVGVHLGWGWLDAGMGLIIAGVIGFSSLQILRQAIHVLMDRAAVPRDAIEALARSIPGVQSVEQVRSRGQHDETYIDLHVRVKPDLPTELAHNIAHAVQDKLKAQYPQVIDVTIHIEPETGADTTRNGVARQLKALANSLNTAAHDIWVYTVGERTYVELHLEVPASLNLTEAHALATRFEQAGATLPSVTTITTHIEPMGGEVKPTRVSETAAIIRQAQQITAAVCGPEACHDFQVWSESEALALSLHCTLPGTLSIIEAHRISEQVKDALLQQLPQLKRVMVHVEPPVLQDTSHLLGQPG